MSTVTDAISTASTIDSDTASKTSTNNFSVDTNTFLTLLVAQLSNQDPLNPQEDTQFITQLAQMTTLEEMQKIGSGMSSIQAYSFVGKYAYAESVDTETGETRYIHGNIDSIVKNGGTYYAIIGEDVVKVSDIVQVFDTSLVEDPQVDLTDLIGQTVTATYDPGDGTTETITGVVTDIVYSNNGIYAVVDGIRIPVENITEIGGGAEEGSDAEQTTEN